MRVPVAVLRHRCSDQVIRVNLSDYERNRSKYAEFQRITEENMDMASPIIVPSTQLVSPEGIPLQSQPEAPSPEPVPEPIQEAEPESGDAEKTAAIDAGLQDMSRRELDDTAQELGIPVQDHWKDETVRRKIAEKLAE